MVAYALLIINDDVPTTFEQVICSLDNEQQKGMMEE